MNNKKDFNINVTLKDATDIVCEECGYPYFKQVVRIKKFSKIITLQDDDTYAPIPVFACEKCGHVNKEMDPTNEEDSGLIS